MTAIGCWLLAVGCLLDIGLRVRPSLRDGRIRNDLKLPESFLRFFLKDEGMKEHEGAINH